MVEIKNMTLSLSSRKFYTGNFSEIKISIKICKIKKYGAPRLNNRLQYLIHSMYYFSARGNLENVTDHKHANWLAFNNLNIDVHLSAEPIRMRMMSYIR